MQGILYFARRDSRSKPDSLSAQFEAKVVLQSLHLTSRFSIFAFLHRSAVSKDDSLHSIAVVVVTLLGLRVWTSSSKQEKKYVCNSVRTARQCYSSLRFRYKSDGRSVAVFSSALGVLVIRYRPTARERARWIFCRESPHEMCEQGIRKEHFFFF